VTTPLGAPSFSRRRRSYNEGHVLERLVGAILPTLILNLGTPLRLLRRAPQQEPRSWIQFLLRLLASRFRKNPHGSVHGFRATARSGWCGGSIGTTFAAARGVCLGPSSVMAVVSAWWLWPTLTENETSDRSFNFISKPTGQLWSRLRPELTCLFFLPRVTTPGRWPGSGTYDLTPGIEPASLRRFVNRSPFLDPHRSSAK